MAIKQTVTAIILAIDPGFDRVGWAVGKSERGQISVLAYGCIQTSPRQTLFIRYQQIIQELEQLIRQHQPTELAIESLFFFKNQKTVMPVSEARGVIIGCCLKANLAVFEYTPLQIKQAVTGYGRADKKQVAKMMRLQLKLDDRPIIDDAMDALATLLTHAATIRPPLR